jgi:zinc/manganese transport system substrate-binding protein
MSNPILKGLLLLFTLFALLPIRGEAQDRLKVVTTTSDLGSIARSIGGDKVEIIPLATGQEDPHHIAAKPSYMMAARKADLWIRAGMELEIGYEGLIIDGARNSKIRVGSPGHLDASNGVLRLEVPTTKIDRSMGDIHPQGNPHYLLDPLNGRLVARTIAKRFAELRPQHVAYFNERYKAFQRELDGHMFGPELVAHVGGSKLWAALLKERLDQTLAGEGCPPLGGWLARTAPFKNAVILPYHRNWSYFMHRFHFTVPMEVEAKPGIPPSPSRLTEVIALVKARSISVLLMAPYFDRDAPDFVASKTDITVVPCGMFPGSQPGVDEYFDVFDNLIQRITTELCKHQPVGR